VGKTKEGKKSKPRFSKVRGHLREARDLRGQSFVIEGTFGEVRSKGKRGSRN